MMSMSERHSPGASCACQCHCSQRLELDSEPSSSANSVVGSSNTSVWIVVGSTSLYSPWFSQNRAVSVLSGSITTMNFILEKASVILARFGNDIRGLKPWMT